MTRHVLLLLAAAILSACPEPEPAVPPPTDVREPCADTNPLRNVYWGDLHVHTALSYDAVLSAVRTTPEEAYRFARGEALDVAGTTAQLQRPLDFAAVTDHAEFLAEVSVCLTPGGALYDEPFCEELRGVGVEGIQTLGVEMTVPDPERRPDICDNVDCLALAGDTWSRLRQAAEDAYDRTSACTFTSFVGYEWTGTPELSNIHRNVLFRGSAVPELPISYFEAPSARQLWDALEAQCNDAETGCEALAIPHNSNLSNGRMFLPDWPVLDPEESAARQAELEPVMEIFQHKGDSECSPGLAGILGEPDELCSFEKVHLPPTDCGDGTGSSGMIGDGCVASRDFLRGALLEGLRFEQELGVNPLRLGVIGSTDTHLGTPGLVDESDWPGHAGDPEDTVEERLSEPPLRLVGARTNPGGLAAVWADSNDRDAIFDALQRREVYGTSGPRMSVRTFGGWDLPEGLCSSTSLVQTGYDEGVPMGGSLGPLPAGQTEGPTFVVSALQDASGQPLERIQIIKGWIDEGGDAHQRVIDVATSDEEMLIDPDTCVSNGAGDASQCGWWRDDDFDPARPAFYYARVLEAPSCRWSALQCLELPPEQRPGSCDDPRFTDPIQERAWTSAIWFTP